MLALYFSVLELVLSQELVQSFNLGCLHETHNFDIATHEILSVFRQASNHGLSDIVGIPGVNDIPEQRRLGTAELVILSHLVYYQSLCLDSNKS